MKENSSEVNDIEGWISVNDKLPDEVGFVSS